LKKYITTDLGGAADEIILGFSPTTLGDFQASLLLKELAPACQTDQPPRPRPADRWRDRICGRRNTGFGAG